MHLGIVLHWLEIVLFLLCIYIAGFIIWVILDAIIEAISERKYLLAIGGVQLIALIVLILLALGCFIGGL